ncbi:MAG: hypothetical protein KKD17_01875 [Nanoarchaeota archaeon]|nr:hypothetical protein [Nanoarchaeota archaeon]
MKFKAGAITATVWRNTLTNKEGKQGDVLSVSFDRRYLDKESNAWKSTSSLRVGDLPKAVFVLNKAYEYVLLNGQSNLAAEIS